MIFEIYTLGDEKLSTESHTHTDSHMFRPPDVYNCRIHVGCLWPVVSKSLGGSIRIVGAHEFSGINVEYLRNWSMAALSSARTADDDCPR